ncbi:hypothetical protein G6645_05230 [Polynucleobacter paneuropaeus]|jgi:hypothetical protein|nr:hypothetical protein [Polynucleobacter paneuropaeus]MBT8531257.1 hypothetical protein [Polynucleobacter paneuropaeus]MBT8602186.1 hypothetical protein [Polynucleobacter paneuropaeus]MBT8624138.1 hypothetical protein [Polynucleobacter paneuropaeus]MBT8628977.1 hypothetical protein [Polynucleobacter paneuropaeus]
MNKYRLKVAGWAMHTFLDEYQNLPLTNNTVALSKTKEILFGKDYMNLQNQVVSGWSIEGLPKSEEIGSYKVSFSGIFHQVLNNNNFGPVLYIYNLVSEILKDNPDAEIAKIYGFVARSLRTFASLLREQSLLEQLEYLFKSDGLQAIFKMSPKQDSQEKTDILIEFNGSTYRLWTYQHSSRGLPHNIERISGKRGSLPPGIHVLCPLISEAVEELGPIQKKITTQKKKISANKEKLILISAPKTKTDQKKIGNITDSTKKCEDKIRELEADFEKVKKTASAYIEEVNGYYFFSDACARNVYDQVIKPSVILSYKDVVDILDSPQILLSKNTVFQVI